MRRIENSCVNNLTSINQILVKAEKILKEYNLCENCLGRLFSKKLHLSSNKLLGKKIRKKLQRKSSTCYICKNLFSNIQSYINKMLQVSADFHFSTFLTGAILKPIFIDRDDSIRSQFQLRGADSIKTEITREINKKFSRITKKKVDYRDPELTFIINFKNDSCEIKSKSLYLFGRYSKKIRGLPQKQKSCENCNGKGCFACNFHGITKFDSVEGKICKYLFEKFKALQAKITWIGGEDRESLVLGKGRPFFVKLLNPKIRKMKRKMKINLDGVTINRIKIIKHIPKEPLLFRSKISILISTNEEVKLATLKKLKSLARKPLEIHEKPHKKTQKSIYELGYRKASKNLIRLNITVDGGFPVKRFVEGNNVAPNVNQTLGVRCTCKEFDFHAIEL